MPVVPFTPRNLQRRDAVLQLLQVEHEVLRPERRALADGRELRRLEVRVAERRQVLPLHREGRQRVDRVGQPRGAAAASRRA